MVEAKKILRIRLSLKGRHVRTYTVDKPAVTIGRSPDCEIILDNTGISREHMRIELAPNGNYQAIDLGSANGTLLNQQPLGKAYLAHEDVLHIGKFTLQIGFEDDRRREEPAPRERDASQFDNTTVMSTDELQRLIDRSREAEAEQDAEQDEESESPRSIHERDERDEEYEPEPVASGPPRSAMVTVVLIAFLLGTAAGAGAVRLLLMH